MSPRPLSRKFDNTEPDQSWGRGCGVRPHLPYPAPHTRGAGFFIAGIPGNKNAGFRVWGLSRVQDAGFLGIAPAQSVRGFKFEVES